MVGSIASCFCAMAHLGLFAEKGRLVLNVGTAAKRRFSRQLRAEILKTLKF
jgi:hypothetical protein